MRKNGVLAKERRLEKNLYPQVSEFVKQQFKCTHVATQPYSHQAFIDVVGLSQRAGKRAADFEVIAIEVKLDKKRFLNCVGQALGYSIMADRCYLAISDENDPIEDEELELAAQLNVGLISIGSQECRIVLTSPKHRPLLTLKLDLVHELGLVECVLCGTLHKSSGKSQKSGTTIQDAGGQKNPFAYHLFPNATWDSGKAIRPKRYLCSDCVRVLSGHGEYEKSGLA